MTREIETWLSDSRVGNYNVVDHRSRRPVLSPLRRPTCVDSIELQRHFRLFGLYFFADKLPRTPDFASHLDLPIGTYRLHYMRSENLTKKTMSTDGSNSSREQNENTAVVFR